MFFRICRERKVAEAFLMLAAITPLITRLGETLPYLLAEFSVPSSLSRADNQVIPPVNNEVSSP